MTPDTPYSTTRKIDPGKRPALKPDGTPDDNDRVEIGPTALALAEWAATGIAPPNLAAMRAFRLDRITKALAEQIGSDIRSMSIQGRTPSAGALHG